MHTETLILGAGPAGLAAAHRLSQHHHDLRLLEARPRIGGRAFTQHSPTVPCALELGAEFIHGLPPEILPPARALSLPVIDGSTTAFFFDGQQLHKADEDDEHLSDALTRIRNYQGPDIPYDAFAAQQLQHLPPEAQTFTRQYIEGFNAADASRIGLHGLKLNEQASEQIQGDRLARFLHGYDTFLHHLLTNFPIHLSTPVHTIEWRPGHVTTHAHAPDGSPLTFTANRIIITLPLALLQRRSVTFTPEPTAILTAADRLAAGHAVKLLLHFREPFWEHVDDANYLDLAFLYAPSEPFPTWWTQLPLRAPLLTAWAGGAQCDDLLHRSPADLLSLALDTLSKVFRQPKSHLASLLQSYHHHPWQSDPHAMAAYSWMPTGASDAPHLLTQPVDNTLFFAGEHTHDQGEIGTLNGALATGYRAANQVLASLPAVS